MNVQQAEAALTRELADVLTEIAPDEAPQAGDIIKHPDETSASESIFAFPGGGEAALIGGWALGLIVSIATSLLIKIQEDAIATAAKSAVNWLASRFPKAKPLPIPSREEVLTRVQSELVARYWDRQDARLAAETIWRAGEQTKDQLILLASAEQTRIFGARQ